MTWAGLGPRWKVELSPLCRSPAFLSRAAASRARSSSPVWTAEIRVASNSELDVSSVISRVSHFSVSTM